MGLIDADKLMQDIRNTITEQSNTIDWLNLINRQPTAYDLDKVVEQLKDEQELSYADFEIYAEQQGLSEIWRKRNPCLPRMG